jgi:hypothetical protein
LGDEKKSASYRVSKSIVTPLSRGQEYRDNADITDLIEVNELDFEGSAKSDVDAPKIKKNLLKTTILS